MTAQMTAYIQIIVGLAGIVATVLAAPSFTALLQARADAVAGSSDLTQTVRSFALIFVLIVFTFIVSLGLATTLQAVAITYGAVRPMLTSALLIAALLSLSMCLLLFLRRVLLWLPAFVGSTLLCLCSLAAATSSTLEGMWLIILFGGFIFLATGGIALMSSDEADLRRNLNDPRPG